MEFRKAQVLLLVMMAALQYCSCRLTSPSVPTSTLKLYSLHVPKHVVVGSDAVLECNYDLNGEELYAEKWYKDGDEFYRYEPNSEYPKLAFPLDGVDVDVERSDVNHVVLKNVDLNTEGDYWCEVSAEAPYFTTVGFYHKRLEVIVLPAYDPVITGGKTSYLNDDHVDLNCTTASSRPKAKITWLINAKPVSNYGIIPTFFSRILPNRTEITSSNLRFRLRSTFFLKGPVTFECFATVAGVFNNSVGHSAKNKGRVYPELITSTEDMSKTSAESETEFAVSASGVMVTSGFTISTAIIEGLITAWIIELSWRGESNGV